MPNSDFKNHTYDCQSKVPARGYNLTQIHRGLIDGKSDWADIEVRTPWGIVTGYAQGDSTYSHITRFDFVWQGVAYHRSFQGKRYSVRACKTKARQFAREIVENNPVISDTQLKIAFGKYVAGYRPGDEGWSAFDDEALAYVQEGQTS